MTEIIHQTNLFDVVVIPENQRYFVVGTHGREYRANYQVIHRQHQTIQASYEDIVNALSGAEYMEYIMSNKKYLYTPPTSLEDQLSQMFVADNDEPDPTVN